MAKRKPKNDELEKLEKAPQAFLDKADFNAIKFTSSQLNFYKTITPMSVFLYKIKNYLYLILIT